MEIDYIETVLRGKERFEFQEYCERYLSLKYNDFKHVATNGRDGDGGKDGYCVNTKEYFAISSNKEVNKKLESDLRNCLMKNDDVEKFTFITNRVETVRDLEIVKKLKDEYPYIRIKVLTYKNIAKDIMKMSERDIEFVLNRKINFPVQRTIFFDEDELKRESFSIKQSFIDSKFYYIVLIIFSIEIFTVSFVFSRNEVMRLTFFVFCFCSIMTFVHFNKERIMKTKFPIRILCLIFSGKLKVGNEVLFDRKSFYSIYRDSLWRFTFRRRTANCLKVGCCGRVYLYTDKNYGIIGKCEKDKRNHIYRVDNNFYGELIPYRYN